MMARSWAGLLLVILSVASVTAAAHELTQADASA
jgi:hypothetical protein